MTITGASSSSAISTIPSHVGTARVARATASNPEDRAISVPSAAIRTASAACIAARAAPAIAEYVPARLSAGVIDEATSRTTARRGPTSAAAVSIARAAPDDPS